MGGMPTDDLGDAQQADPATPNQPSTPSPEATRTLVFDERATAHSPAEDILGILTGTFTASLGLYLLQSSEAVTGGTAGLALLIQYASGLPFWMLFLIINLRSPCSRCGSAAGASRSGPSSRSQWSRGGR